MQTARQSAAFRALGLLRVMVEWESIPAKHARQAKEIVQQADSQENPIEARALEIAEMELRT